MSKKYLENIHVGVLGIMQFFFHAYLLVAEKENKSVEYKLMGST